MKKNTSSMLVRYGVTTCLSLGAVAFAQDEPKKAEISVEEVANTERVMRQKNVLEAKVLKKSSLEAEAKGEFENAINFASQALEKIKTVSKTDEEVLAEVANLEKNILRLKYSYVDSLINSALQNNKPEKAEQALELLKELKGTDPASVEAVEKIIAEATAAKVEAERRSTVSAEQIAEDAEEEELDASTILEKCSILYKNQEFEEVINELEKLLIKQPYNIEANKALSKVYAELRRIGVIRRDVVQKEKVSEVTWKWNNPLNPEQESVSVTTSTETKTVASGIFKKLELVIPKVNYVNASVESVVSNIKRVTKLLDPDGVGLNIVLKISKDLGEDASLIDDEESVASGVNLEFDQIPVEELLKYFCDQAGLKFRVEEYAIVITEKGAETSFDMTTKFYPVAPNFQDAIDGTGGGAGDEDFGGDDFEDDFEDDFDDFEEEDSEDEEDTEELEEDTEEVEAAPTGGPSPVQAYFEALGVSFPEGATVKYVPKVSRLVVKNTAENLRKVESALEHINVIQNQIMIESKFAEVSQTDNEELGFDWIYRGQNGATVTGLDVDGDNGATVLSNGTTNRPTFLSSGTKDGQFAVRPLVQAVENTGVQAGLPAAGVNNLEIDAVIGSADFSVFIRSIDQKRNLDVLTAPKVTTTTGNPAIVKVIDERYFPVEFEDPEIVEVSSTFITDGQSFVEEDENTIIRPHPVYEEPTEIGVVLEVTPKVNPDNYTIELTLNPRVTEFIQYDDAFDALLDPDGEAGGFFSIFQGFDADGDPNYVTITNEPAGFSADPDAFLSGADGILGTADDNLANLFGQDSAISLRYAMPIITSRTIDTQVMVWDGETIVLGGLSNEESIVYNDGIPYLKDIPFVGRLFETKGAQKIKTNLLIFVTSRLVKPDGVPRSNK